VYHITYTHNNIILFELSDEMVKEKQEIVEENRRKELIKDQQLVSVKYL